MIVFVTVNDTVSMRRERVRKKITQKHTETLRERHKVEVADTDEHDFYSFTESRV